MSRPTAARRREVARRAARAELASLSNRNPFSAWSEVEWMLAHCRYATWTMCLACKLPMDRFLVEHGERYHVNCDPRNNW